MFKILPFIILFLFSSIDSVRANIQINAEEIKKAVITEFSEQGIEEEIELDIFGGQSSFNIPAAAQTKIMVSRLEYDEMQNKFTADVEIFADGNSAGKTTLIGKYYTMEEIYVPVRNIEKGEVIQEADLKRIKVRKTRIKPMYVTELSKLTGQEAKRSLKTGKMISNKEIGSKILVHKNDNINLQYRTRQMQIIAKGIAQEDGALGQKIEVENTQSHKKVYGTVVSADTIVVENQ